MYKLILYLYKNGGAWKFSGNVQNLSTGETYTGNMSGMAKDMNSMQQGLNVDDVSMTGKERANLGDVKGENVAFIQGTVVDSNLSASDIIHKDKTRTENTTDEKNYSYERTTDIDTSRTEKDNYIREKKVVEDNTTSISTGTHYKGVAQAAMGKTEDFEKMMSRLADMKQAVLNGDMSAKEFQAEVRNFSGAYAQEMGQFLDKKETDSWGTNVKGSAGAEGQVTVDSKDQVAGKVASAVTGVSYSGNIHAGVELGISRDDRTQSAQNLIAKEMYDTIIQSGNVNDMVNNASNLANKHADTNLSGIDMAMNEIPKAVDGLKEKAGNFSEQHLDRILK